MVRVRFPAMAEYLQEFLLGGSHSVNPSWASMAENGSISPQQHHTTVEIEEGAHRHEPGIVVI